MRLRRGFAEVLINDVCVWLIGSPVLHSPVRPTPRRRASSTFTYEMAALGGIAVGRGRTLRSSTTMAAVEVFTCLSASCKIHLTIM